MKTYQRMNLRRLEAALRVHTSRRSRTRAVRYDVVPVEDASYPSSPTEVIDLATGPFQARFPGLGDPGDASE